ncbi:MAG: hypothetical protein IH886_13580 [Nitrospinae bacterium]|nr:hypothetical protein [Nitrospinota bacterium]
MKYDKYSDQLLAQQATIPTSTIFEILIGYSWRDLSDFKKHVKLGSSLADKQKQAKGMAVSASFKLTKSQMEEEERELWRKNFKKREDQKVTIESIRKPVSFDVKNAEENYLALLIASEAYSILSEWMGIKFYNDTTGLNIGQIQSTVNVFLWIDEEQILANLENRVDGFKAPKRAREFIGYMKEAVETTGRNEPKKQEQGREFLPAPVGTKWKEVSIKITVDAQIRIEIKGKNQLYNLDKFKREIITQEKARGYLFLIIRSGGAFVKNDIDPDEDKGTFRTRISRLRDSLQTVFGIQADPILYDHKAYQTQFTVSSDYEGVT